MEQGCKIRLSICIGYGNTVNNHAHLYVVCSRRVYSAGVLVPEEPAVRGLNNLIHRVGPWAFRDPAKQVGLLR